jgi:aryl-alcohol dehydrogenase-like predicted oxidoreductase
VLEEDVVTLQETLEALSEVVKAGKARYIGISNETPWGVHEYLRLSKEMNLPRIVSIQNQYSLTNRTYEIGLAELCLRENISLLAYSCIDGGALSGKYLGGAKPEGSRFYLPDYTPANFMRYNAPCAQDAIQAYVDIAKKYDLDPAQMALAFAFKRPCMGSVIIGATTMEQLKTNIEAAAIHLSEEVMADINQIYLARPDSHA